VSRVERVPRRTRWVRITGAVMAAVLAAGVVGCSSTGGKRAEERREQALEGGGPTVNTPRWKVAMVTHSGDGDTFWDIVQNGAEMASRKDNIEFLYAHDKDAGRQAQLVKSMIDKKVDGLIVTLAKPEAMKEVVSRAVEAGIPVITINSGQDRYEEFGALTHIGQDEVVAGEAVGEELNERGREQALCVVHEQGNVGLDQRCTGVENTFEGDVERLYVEGTNMPSVESSISAKLQSVEKIDSVVTLGAPFAATAAKSVDQTGSDAKVATFDLNAQVVDAMKDGSIRFAVDQQPYLQGYEAVDLMWLQLYNGDVLGGGKPVLTGPQIVTPEDVPELEKYTKRGTR
jgi:simple sugar transport system substrate-binding protein